MVIDSYVVHSQSEYSYSKTTQTTLSHSIVTLPADGKLEGLAAHAAEKEATADSVKEQIAAFVELSSASLKKAAEESQKFQQYGNIGRANGAGGISSRLASNPLELKMSLLEQLLFALTGKRFRAQPLSAYAQSSSSQSISLSSMSFSSAAVSAQSTGAQYDVLSIERASYESETVSYQATGLIQTADGRSISVDVGLYMSRETASYVKADISSQKVQLCDPLVINYAGTAASLSNEKFQFDLDCDGNLDSISFATNGSGFLALDKNGDGVINDGSELFGPQSGNGFDELRKYDQDGNNWIDENDEVFSQLRIWSKDAEGNDQLFTLKELGVGAIFLGDVSTQFTMNDSEGATQGVMRSTSFFLGESGGAGTISHIDLAI